MNKKEVIKNIYTIIILVFVVVIISLISPNKKREKNNTANQNSYLKVTGGFSCLTSIQPNDLGCIPAIISDDGVSYILNVSNVSMTDTSIDGDTRVSIDGGFIPIQASSNSVFLGTQAAGILVADTIVRAD